MKLSNFLLFVTIEITRGTVVFKSEDESASKNTLAAPVNGTARDGRNLLNWISSFTDSDADPYLARANAACIEGDLSECFKSKALSSLDDFFTKESFSLNENTKILRMPEEHVRRVYQEPYEYSSMARSEEPEWDHFVKFLMRKVERFLKSTAVEVKFSEDVTENGRYSPRFIDEISSELDTIEDKKGGVLTRAKLKKLFIPLLLMVKLFKLKLLLFLPLILGLASFKKFLGFLAIVIPGMIGFFKLCKPDLQHNYGSFGHSSFYYRPPHQYARPDHTLYGNEYRATESPDVIQYLYNTYSGSDNQEYYAKNTRPDHKQTSSGSSSVAFREDRAYKLANDSHRYAKR